MISLQLHVRHLSKIASIVYQKDSRSFQQWVQQEAKQSILQDYELTDRQTDTHTHTHTTDCYNPPPTLGLMTVDLCWHLLLKFGSQKQKNIHTLETTLVKSAKAHTNRLHVP